MGGIFVTSLQMRKKGGFVNPSPSLLFEIYTHKHIFICVCAIRARQSFLSPTSPVMGMISHFGGIPPILVGSNFLLHRVGWGS